MNNTGDRLRTIFVITMLTVANAGLSWTLLNAHQQNRRALAGLITANAALEDLNKRVIASTANYRALIGKANKLAFAAALYGYEARRQGMETGPFVAQAATIFGTTNLPEVHIEIGTNGMDARALNKSNWSRRL